MASFEHNDSPAAIAVQLKCTRLPEILIIQVSDSNAIHICSIYKTPLISVQIVRQHDTYIHSDPLPFH